MHTLNMIYYQMLQTHGQPISFETFHIFNPLIKHDLFSNVTVSPRVPLVEVLMIKNQVYWLLMVKDELSDRLKLIKHQIKIIQAKDDNDVVDRALGKELRRQVTKIPSSSIK